MIGHKHVIERFTSAIASNTLAHAYVFVGSASVGKRTTAEWLLKTLLKTEHLDAHPDFVRVERCLNPKTGKMREQISIDQIVEATRRFAMRSVRVPKKALLIQGAESLSIAAANALLKTLEEPRGDALIILTSVSEQALLPTILSRTQRVRFHALSFDEVADALKERGVEREAAEVLAAMANGLPGRALTLMDDEEQRSNIERQLQTIRACFSPRPSERILAVHDMIPPYDADHVKTRTELKRRLALFETVAHKHLLAASGCGASPLLGDDAPVLSIAQAGNILTAIQSAKARLEAHVDPHLTLIHTVMSYAL
ncbi:hypothetical protein A3B32_01895 [Candidatus Uhrbacteria bacterium RIFCSPLOWO2_01_FULL_53_9]|uniref:DNA polymerase III subunit delta n=3 Tax=Candidatus Uhriibacteriota TaxID=1752732 RepID=A0A1F7UXM0_9BACT|nr:MAG: hypothetical protein A3C17_02775 [Candidatus Uhrbacteria bacterium RIFCSPHIGHO2_02_FULL_53_13]OGL83030.1 MAG: hypothetical protein A3B32_01895 [Candidatus Uhrbacteria bacterium RIFCSPLOWO2_01_FULL_53_9]OGL89848.1 MAG: hypothetical protein A3I45_02100 [Candidatus Uhrbacteria bacterium RIFCSPLOWO2_02_FULL_53_10]